VVSATTYPSGPGGLGLLVDDVTGVGFLADTGSVYSLLPHSSTAPSSDPKLITADSMPVACWGAIEQKICAAGRIFRGKFLLAAVSFPIVGADFLKTNELLVDIGAMQLVHRAHGWRMPLQPPKLRDTCAAAGVRGAVGGAAKQGRGSSGGQRGPTLWDVTPHPIPAEPALNSGSPGGQQRSPSSSDQVDDQRLAVVASVAQAHVGGDVDYQALLSAFPAVLNPSKQLPPAIHEVKHVIETTGRPVSSKYRRLDPERLAAARAEFAESEKQGIISRSSSSWSSPLYMVKKPDGTWRPCGDFCRLNLQTPS